jgi:hypothetical protein
VLLSVSKYSSKILTVVEDNAELGLLVDRQLMLSSAADLDETPCNKHHLVIDQPSIKL